MAFATAWRMAQVVKTVVGRPMHVAVVNGLKRNLDGPRSVLDNIILPSCESRRKPYRAATTSPVHLLSFRGDVNKADDPASLESAIIIRACALNRSAPI